MNDHHFQHESYNTKQTNIVHKISLEHKPCQFKAPMSQPFHLSTKQATMWDLAQSSPVIQQKPKRASEAATQHQLLNKTLYPYQPICGAQPLPPTSTTPPDSPQQIYLVEPDEDPMQHLVLLPLGKTGAGKSSLLNILLRYDEFKAKAGAKSVTDCITERTGTWIVDKEALITVADTPGFADSMQRDAAFLKNFQDYILDLGSRIGIDAFLLVFQCDSATSNIMAILDYFDTMMSSLQETNDWWSHVILVFTRVDYYPNLKFPPNILLKKQAITQQLIPEIQSKYNLAHPPKYAFVSSKAPNCSYNKKGHCDCFAAQKYHLDQMRTLKSGVNAILQENGRRWAPSALVEHE